MIRDRENFLRVDELIVITGRHNILAIYYDLSFSRNIINKTFSRHISERSSSERSRTALRFCRSFLFYFLFYFLFSIFRRSITVLHYRAVNQL